MKVEKEKFVDWKHVAVFFGFIICFMLFGDYIFNGIDATATVRNHIRENNLIIESVGNIKELELNRDSTIIDSVGPHDDYGIVYYRITGSNSYVNVKYEIVRPNAFWKIKSYKILD